MTGRLVLPETLIDLCNTVGVNLQNIFVGPCFGEKEKEKTAKEDSKEKGEKEGQKCAGDGYYVIEKKAHC